MIVRTNRRHDAGLTLLELLVLVAVVGGLAAWSLPRVGVSEQSPQEVAVIHTLKSIAAAQRVAKNSRCIDVDRNGVGEFGFLGELTGVVNVRADESGGLPEGALWVSSGTAPGREAGLADATIRHRLPAGRLDPAPLALVFGDITNGRIEKGGYLFQVCLPDSAGVPQAESTFGGGTGVQVRARAAEKCWCCYAWPVRFGETGTRCYFIDQTGEVYSAANSLRYSGHETPPPSLAAYAGRSMTLGVADTSTGVDGQTWRPIAAGR